MPLDVVAVEVVANERVPASKDDVIPGVNGSLPLDTLNLVPAAISKATPQKTAQKVQQSDDGLNVTINNIKLTVDVENNVDDVVLGGSPGKPSDLSEISEVPRKEDPTPKLLWQSGGQKLTEMKNTDEEVGCVLFGTGRSYGREEREEPPPLHTDTDFR